MYSIGELAKRTNISVRTLRYYDEIGLLKPAKVAESGYRYYANEEIRKLQHITALKELGFTLAAIKEILAGGHNTKEERWMRYLEIELDAIHKKKARLDVLERALLVTKHALEMKGEVDSEDIFMFIHAVQRPTIEREAFRQLHFTEAEIEILERLPDLSSDDSRNTQWAACIREIKENINEDPASPKSMKLAEQIVDISNSWFNYNDELIEKYWSLVRPEEGEKAKVYGLDKDVFEYIDKIVDIYLTDKAGGKDEENE